MKSGVQKTSLLIGLKAARANLVPSLFIQAGMLALVIGYYRSDAIRNWLNVLAGWKAAWGYSFSTTLAVGAGALFPELLKILALQRGRPNRANLENLFLTVPLWILLGFSVDTLYRLQATWFGTIPTAWVLVKKVLVDQFVYNPIWAAPISVWGYDWKERRYSTNGLSVFFTRKYYGAKILPTLVATWGVWIPVVSMIYALPPLLQIPLFGLALSFWSLILAYINSDRKR